MKNPDRHTGYQPLPVSCYIFFWLGPLVAVLFALQMEFSRLADQFDRSVPQAIIQIESKANNFEIALEGFANFLAISGELSDAEIRAYVQGIRKLYPDLYMFEISSRVDHRQRAAFEQQMRDKGYHQFKIHGFDYDGERRVTEIAEQLVYYPIRFIEPETASNIEVLGLDLSSTSSVLVETMIASLQQNRPIASRPFKLLEGGKGYVLYRPVASNSGLKQDLSDFPLNFAMLVVRGDKMLPEWLQDRQRYSVSLAYTSALEGSIEEYLIEPEQPERDVWIVHSYRKTVAIASESQPYKLTLQRHIQWSDFNLARMFLVILSGSLLVFFIGGFLARSERRKNLVLHERNRLYRQANYDQLTGLPNLNLLTELAQQAIRVVQRSGGCGALFYLDIDKFKSVNDCWGHEAGDELLKQIAFRLKQTLREEDVASRIHGDEFILLLPDVAGREGVELVEARILSAFARPFSIAGHPMTVNISIGVVIFPDDSVNLDVLLKVGDQRMYQSKQAGHSVVSLPQ